MFRDINTPPFMEMGWLKGQLLYSVLGPEWPQVSPFRLWLKISGVFLPSEGWVFAALPSLAQEVST